eukprot:TRINITY_DN58649_c0_g1_i1.p3 TRINITY_DN58649_c0_g1~~TRINITY_DN58649_c0_g1_i1.p3  ORF type:complete len:125 (+),score=38.04 TRINITY_DN58649_c0_g1_i1:14-388(+)
MRGRRGLWQVIVFYDQVMCCFVFFFSSRRRHTRCREVSWARRCVQETAQKVAKTHRVAAAPSDAALGIDPLEETDQKHAEIDTRGNTRATMLTGIEGSTEVFDEFIEAVLGKKLVQLDVEGVAG